MEELELFINKFRVQRHDFMNILQIISGYIQLDREEEALKYINTISEVNENISSLYSLGDKYLAFALESCIMEMDIKNMNLEVEILEFKHTYFKRDFQKKYMVLKTLIMDILKKENENIFIYIYENHKGISIRMSNFEVIEELDHTFFNVTEDYGLSHIDIFKLEEDARLCYELNLKIM